jgi:hypothetical protein
MYSKRMRFGRKAGWAATGSIVVIIAVGGFVAYQRFGSEPQVKVPVNVAQSVSFPIYIPQKLPEGYSIEQASFQHVSGEGVVLFQASDKAGDKLVFSEQAKPAGFNFDDFTSKQLVNSKSLPNVPYPTTVGKTLDKQTTLISIVTDKTWIIATTQSEFSNQQLQAIAASIRH